jgi:hypothetical protein
MLKVSGNDKIEQEGLTHDVIVPPVFLSNC